jgi:hypothetical protein
MIPGAGDVLVLDAAASPQFRSALLFRVIRVHDWATYDGWKWIDGYELNDRGDAVERRSVFVQLDGLRQAPQAAPSRPAARAQPGQGPSGGWHAPPRRSSPPR